MSRPLLHFNPERITLADVPNLFQSQDRGLLEALVQAAKDLTARNFVRTVALYAPLYIANHCQNHCTYCGFQVHTTIQRQKLTLEEIDAECAALAATGIRSCLILTGESRHHSPPTYIAEAIALAGKYFANVSLEVYPLDGGVPSPGPGGRRWRHHLSGNLRSPAL